MHWTYESYDDSSDLIQGDILEPSANLLELFKDVHPHFTNPKYRGFLILTQSCDLARRESKGNRFSATHISLSVIRSIQDIISDSLKNHFGYLAPGIYNVGMKFSVEALAERLVNQNENSLGLFYLHPQLDFGISVPSVAILRVSISLKAQHYARLLKARVGRLSKEFQPKLGWMVGNLYSRVGVPDWKEKSDEENNEEKTLNQILSFSREEPIWMDKKAFTKILEQKEDFDKLPPSEQEGIIEEFQPKPPKEEVLEIIANTIQNTVNIKTDQLETIRHKLSNNDRLEAQMRKFGRF